MPKAKETKDKQGSPQQQPTSQHVIEKARTLQKRKWKGQVPNCVESSYFLKTQDGAEFDISGSNEVPDSASVGESKTDGNSSIDDFRSEPGNTECFKATGNRRQMRDGRIGR